MSSIIEKEYKLNNPTLVIGTFGNVSDGKTEMINALTGIRTTKHSSEKKRNITMKSGYANFKIWKNKNDNLESTNSSYKKYPFLYKNKEIINNYKKLMKKFNKIKLINYEDNMINEILNFFQKYTKNKIHEYHEELVNIQNKINKMNKYIKSILTDRDFKKFNEFNSLLEEFINLVNHELNNENNNYEMIVHGSFMDNPGHIELIKTMLNSVELINGIIIVISVAEDLNTKEQLKQHLNAVKLSGIENIIVCLNKIDLIDRELVMIRKRQIDSLLKEYEIYPRIIIPTSFPKKIGCKNLMKYIIQYFNNDKNNKDGELIAKISRTFDVNKPGIDYKDLKGGVLGTCLISGKLSVGDNFEVRPGIIKKDNTGKIISCEPLKSVVKSLQTDGININTIYPGGLVGIGTDIDSFHCKADKLIGNRIGNVGKMPSNYYPNINIKFSLLNTGIEWKKRTNEKLNLQIGTKNVKSLLTKIKSSKKKKINAIFQLESPICLKKGEKIIISKNINNFLQIIGFGEFIEGDILTK